MTVLPLSREHPVWPSCLYHGYTVYSPVHEHQMVMASVVRQEAQCAMTSLGRGCG